MPATVSIPIYTILLICLFIRMFIENNSIREYIKDNTTKGYHLTFKFINNDTVSFITNIEEFNKIKKWYIDSRTKENYLLSKDGEYVNLNKVNIIKFNYETINNRNNILKPIAYILNIKVPKVLNVLNYIKSIFLFFILCLAFNMYDVDTLNTDLKEIINTNLLNQNLIQASKITTFLFIFYYICYFIFERIKLLNKNKYYFYEAQNNEEFKIYNSAIVNFLVILILFLGLV